MSQTRIEELIEIISQEIKKIKNGLPFGGRRMEVTTYQIPEEWFNILMEDEDFRRVSEEGNPNLGGIPIKIGKFKILFIQKEKRRKVWKG